MFRPGTFDAPRVAQRGRAQHPSLLAKVDAIEGVAQMIVEIRHGSARRPCTFGQRAAYGAIAPILPRQSHDC